MRVLDMTGEKHGRLTVLYRDESVSGRGVWVCECDCGNIHKTRGENLRSGRTTSCGCYQKEQMSKRSVKHGYEYGSDEYKEHHRNMRFIRKYGITTEDYLEIIESQDNECAICGTSISDLDHTAHLDHCHDTGKVRGVLCRRCNTGIGMLNDDPDTLMKAVNYLINAR